MIYDPALTVFSDPDVYPPSEDSVLFIESLDIRPGEKVLEIGCGSGIVSMHCARYGADVTCGDINPAAVALARKNAEYNGIAMNAIETDLFSSVSGRYDTILFNLPYLPVEEEGALAKAWSGGKDGLGPLPELILGAPAHLLPEGRIAIVVSSLMNPNALNDVLAHLNVKVIGELPLFFERLQVLEIRFT